MRHPEANLQAAAVRYFYLKYGKLGAVAASFANERKGTAKNTYRLKQMGLRSGIPDLGIFYEGRTLFIEFKIKPNKLTPRQLETQALLLTTGFTVKTVYDIGEAITVIDKFILQ